MIASEFIVTINLYVPFVLLYYVHVGMSGFIVSALHSDGGSEYGSGNSDSDFDQNAKENGVSFLVLFIANSRSKPQHFRWGNLE